MKCIFQCSAAFGNSPEKLSKQHRTTKGRLLEIFCVHSCVHVNVRAIREMDECPYFRHLKKGVGCGGVGGGNNTDGKIEMSPCFVRRHLKSVLPVVCHVFCSLWNNCFPLPAYQRKPSNRLVVNVGHARRRNGLFSECSILVKECSMWKESTQS